MATQRAFDSEQAIPTLLAAQHRRAATTRVLPRTVVSVLLSLWLLVIFSLDAWAAPRDAAEFPHDGRTNDVSAIGQRNVGCNQGLGNWMSLESQIRLGRQIAAEYEHQARLVTDPVIVEYVNRLTQNLARHSDAQVPFTITVLDDDTVNAFALPGGFFYVQSGLILAADNEAELAGVLAHEIAHVAACHAARSQTRSNLANLASLPLIFVGGGLGLGVYQVAGLGVPLTFMKFSRTFEAQADYLGVQYLYAAGYDPQALPQFFAKLETMERQKHGVISQAFQSHPPTPARRLATQKEIATILPPRSHSIVDSSEFQQVKARLTARCSPTSKRQAGDPSQQCATTP